jgi:hypothetical protein
MSRGQVAAGHGDSPGESGELLPRWNFGLTARLGLFSAKLANLAGRGFRYPITAQESRFGSIQFRAGNHTKPTLR